MLRAVFLIMAMGFFSRPARAAIQFEQLQFDPPQNWRIHQHAKDQSTILMSLTNGADQAHMYAKTGTGVDMKATFAFGSEILRDITEFTANGITWQTLLTKKTNRDISTTIFVAAFSTERKGVTYYGYSRGRTQAESLSNATALMTATTAAP